MFHARILRGWDRRISISQKQAWAKSKDLSEGEKSDGRTKTKEESKVEELKHVSQNLNSMI